LSLEKFWRKLASGKIVVVYKNGTVKMTTLKTPILSLKLQFDEYDADENIKAILSSAASSDSYDSLYKKAKASSVEYVVSNYKKFFKKAGSIPKDLIKKGYPKMEKMYYI
jgi:hypothetical protein